MEWKQIFGVLSAGLFTLFAVLHGLFAVGNSMGRRVWGADVDASNGAIRAASGFIALLFLAAAVSILQTGNVVDLGLPPHTRDILVSSLVFWIAIESGEQLLRRRVTGWRARLVIVAVLLLVTLPVVIG